MTASILKTDVEMPLYGIPYNGTSSASFIDPEMPLYGIPYSGTSSG